MSKNSEEKLEELQDMFLKLVLKTPGSTPKPALKFETGTMPMKYRIYERKLLFANRILRSEGESLAKEVLCKQDELQWPGLAKEVKDICVELDLPNIMKENIPTLQWKKAVKEACNIAATKELKKSMEDMSKVKHLVNEDFERKDYIKKNNIYEARTMFKLRSKMVEVKMNYKSDPRNSKELWRCDSCKSGALESQTHVLYCTAYSDLRIGKNLEDMDHLVKYFSDVMAIRSKLQLIK